MTVCVPDVLQRGEIEIKGRMPWSSNATFLCELTLDEQECLAVYKPARGERPLWDFPSGLYQREIAAYELSEALGWDLVPPTVLREGPLGDGSMQLFVEADFAEHYFTLHEKRPEFHDRMRAMAAFDVIANNTDRKSGHVLLATDGPMAGLIFGIDHGVCFHEDWKLRTVIWEFSGETIPAELLPGITRLAQSVPESLAGWLSHAELDAVRHRAQVLAEQLVFPTDSTGHRYPWPMV